MPATKARQQYSEETILRAAAIAKLRAERAAREQRIEELKRNRPPWLPYKNSPQVMALNSQAHELFYGGAAGGGKTDLLIGCALLKHHRSIIFRREFPQLAAIIQRSYDIFTQIHPIPKYNTTTHMWRNLPFDKTLEFGAMQFLKDREKYQGRPHDFKGYDEITQFLRDQYTYANAWNRTTKPNQRFRSVATGNPPMSAEGEWVIEYWGPWLDSTHKYPARPGDIRWYATIEGKSIEVEDGKPFYTNGLLVEPRSRTFIPARLSDNPILFQAGYAGVLQGLPEPMRSRLLFGDFEIQVESDQWQVIPTQWIIAAQERWKLATDTGHQATLSSIGLDVSRGGADKTVIAMRYGAYFAELIEHEGTDTPDGPAAAKHLIRALGLDADSFAEASYFGTPASQIPINVDTLAVGAAAYDALKYVGLNAYSVKFNEASTATDSTGRLDMLNLRAEGYWLLRELLDPEYGIGICLPPNRLLAAELAAAKWEPTIHGIKVEDKRLIAARLGHSPDRADAVVLAALDMASKLLLSIPTSSSSRDFGLGTSQAVHNELASNPVLNGYRPGYTGAPHNPGASGKSRNDFVPVQHDPFAMVYGLMSPEDFLRSQGIDPETGNPVDGAYTIGSGSGNIQGPTNFRR